MMLRAHWLDGRRPLINVRSRRSAESRWARVKGWLLLVSLTLLLLIWMAYHLLQQPHWLVALPPQRAQSLTLIEAAGAFTLGWVWIGLWWRQHTKTPKEPASPLSVEELYALSPRAFEKYAADLFRRKGYEVRHRGRSGDAGVDLELVSPSGKRAIVQCKRYRTTVGPEIVRELFGTMIHEGVPHAFLVTTADISPSARDWSRGKPMTLIDGAALIEIGRALSGHGGRSK